MVNSALRLTCLCLTILAAPVLADSEKPNFVVIFIDDLGYGDIGPFGSTLNQTPHLDRMAKEGLKLTSFYVAAPVCTPSRAALMTGCYPRRVGLAKGSGHAVLFPGDVHGLNPDEITIAEVLKEEGYATGCFGKWHLGDQPGFFPTDQGFDTYYGIPYSNDMWAEHPGWHFPKLPILRGTKVVGEVKDSDDQGRLCQQFTDEAVKFIRKSHDQPFFVYLPHAFVHHPRSARPEFMDKASNETEAQIEEVDWSAGQILETLRELKLGEKTLVLFTSDNGGARGCVNTPLRGGKGSAFEGGMREPTLAWWPGTIPAGSTTDQMATAMDLMPTFAKLVGADLPTDRVIDGRDVSALLLDPSNAKTPHDRFFYHQGENLRAVRSGPWKLFRDGKLYQLDNDIGETKNVAKSHPNIVKRLRGYIDEFETELASNSRQVGVFENPRTLLPREGVEGEEGFRPTLELGKRKANQ